MNLSVIGKFGISQLEAWVTEKFSPVVNKDVVLPDQSDPAPYPASHLRKLIKFVPVEDQDKFTFWFFLPYCGGDHRASPVTYLTELIGHEGENSLLSFLKSENLASGLETDKVHWCDCLSMF